MGSDELINKHFNIPNEINDKSHLIVERDKLSETLKIIENCTSCKDNIGKHFDDKFHKPINNKIENLLAELGKGEQKSNHIMRGLKYELIRMDKELSEWILCKDCKRKKIETGVDKLTKKSFNVLNEIKNKEGYLKVRTTNLSNELLETLNLVENCTNCKDNIKMDDLDEFCNSINSIRDLSSEPDNEEEKEYMFGEIIGDLYYSLVEMDNKLNKEILCEGCKGKKIEKLTDKCGNEEMAKLLYEYKLNARYNYIEWIPFNEFENIEYLAKGGFGEVHKASWIACRYCVVLKKIYNSSNKIINILREVKRKKV